MSNPKGYPTISKEYEHYRKTIIDMVNKHGPYDQFRALKIRRKLGCLAHSVSNRKRTLVIATISYLKKAAGEQLDETKKVPNHQLTDHAFVVALQRMYGINVGKLKDYVMHDIDNNREFMKITSHNNPDIIITMFKKVI